MSIPKSSQALRRLGLSISVTFALLWLQALEARPTTDSDSQTLSNVMIEELVRAAAAGDPDASYRLGTFLALHSRSADDLVAAEEYLRFAAEHDHIDAQHGLGLFLIGKDESDERIDEGLYWLGLAVTLGDALSAVVLGRLHEFGMHGVPKNLCLAQDWYEVGAMLGLNPPAGYLEGLIARQSESC